jgi:alpha-mannosidase
MRANVLSAAIAIGLSASCALVCEGATTDVIKVDQVWVVFKTHFDLGYTDLAENVFTKYRVNMMDGALKVIDQNRSQPPDKRFVWTVAGWPLARAILDREPDQVRKQRIEAAIREGSLAVHALPATLHTESFDLEDLVRSLHYSSRLARDYGRPLSISGKMTDVPEHSWVLPTVMAHAGIKFLQIGCNSACQYPRVPRLFWWEGPDGSRILCNYTVDYGSGITPPPDWPSRNYLAMIMTGDNHGPPSPQDVEKVRAEIAKRVPGAKMICGSLDDFARAVLAEKPTLSVVRGDTPDTWIHGLLSMPEATKIARNIRPLEPALDSLDTHLKSYGLKTDPLSKELANAYEGSFLYGEHTWGMNGGYGGRDIWPLEEWKTKLPLEKQKRFLQSFEDHGNYIRATQTIVQRELKTRLALLATSVNAEGERIVVWNALPWARSGMVDVGGRSLYAEDVPANGYKTYPVSSAALAMPVLNDPPGVLNTPFYTVTFDLTRGGIASLIDKKSGRELVDNSSPYAVGQFLHERFSKNEVDRFFKAYSRMPGGWALDDLGKPGMPEAVSRAKVLENIHATAPGQPNPGAMGKPGIPEAAYLAVTPSKWTMQHQQSRDADRVVLKAGDTRALASAYTLTFTFSRHSNFIDVEWNVTDKTPDKMPEGGWLCFPFAVSDPRFTVGRLGGPIDPAKDIISGANRHLMAVASGVAMTRTDQTGMALCPLDSPLVSLEKPGLWWWSMDFVPKKSTVFVNLYNNMWNTNFPLWQEGSWSNRVRFWPLLNEKSSESLAVKSMEARLPLQAASANSKAGPLAATATGLTLSRKGVLVTAFGIDPDGNPGTLLRVWEQAGNGGELLVTLPKGMNASKATPVNLRGEKTGESITINDGTFKLNLGAYAPASFVLY